MGTFTQRQLESVLEHDSRAFSRRELAQQRPCGLARAAWVVRRIERLLLGLQRLFAASTAHATARS